MRTMKKLGAAVAAALVLVSLSGCGGSSGGGPDDSSGGDLIAPITMGVNDLQGTDVELVVGQVLNIDTENLAVESYSGEVADPSIAKFEPGRDDGSAEFNPGVEALATGNTEVTMTNEQEGIQPLTFRVLVSKRE